jgi:chromosome segregation ATPase
VNATEGARLAVVENEVKHLSRQLAEHRAETQALAATAKESREELSAKLDGLHALFEQAKGARWAIALAAGIVSAIGGVIVWIAKYAVWVRP